MKIAVITAILLAVACSVFAATCPHCGGEVKEGWAFCPSCGQKIEKKTSLKECPACAFPLKEGWKVCPACGRSLVEEKAAPAREARILWDFEGPRDFSSWRQFDGLQAAQVKEHSTSGQNAVKIDFPAEAAGAPAFRYEGAPLDFRGYRRFEADVYNPGAQPLRIFLKFKSSEHRRQTTLTYDIPAGAHKTISIPIDAIAKQVDLSDIFYLNLFHWKPVNGGEYYIDNIRLIK